MVGTSSCCKGRTFGRTCDCLAGLPSTSVVRVYVIDFMLGGALDSGKNIAENIYRMSKRNVLTSVRRARGVRGRSKGTMVRGRSKSMFLSISSPMSVGV